MNLDSNIYVGDYNVESVTPEDSKNDQESKQEESHSMWSFSFYQRFFQVTTDQVITRLIWSMLPKPGTNYFRDVIKSNPDLYGPIWISLTLIFTVTMSGNLGSYFQLSSTTSDPSISWKYDFHLMSLAATCILSYCWLLPLVLWAVVKWTNGQEVKGSYLELICVYGYCITIFIPVSLFWVIQITWLQWFLACLGTLLSGTVLYKSIIPILGERNYLFMIMIISFHFLLSLSLLWNCFQGSIPKSNNGTLTNN